MREIVLDTETTGFDPESGDRLVEIGAVELMNHMPTGRIYHQYINPERDMPVEAFNVHGLSAEFLSDKPKFAEIVQEFLDFVGQDAKLVIHNASFDMKFLNAELKWARKPILPMSRAIDTLQMARQKFPGSPATLDALCRRFGVDLSVREKHGALLDSELLAEVYLELVGGRQPGLVLSAAQDRGPVQSGPGEDWRPRPRPVPLPPRLTEEEAAAHAAMVEKMGEKAIWLRRSPK
ncbi:DNA polymerase III subunit epsilon [Phaeovulum vinaykumarii]|uniref:DNA polymerase III subunit epsilon n=1 Tax=Phaeovulum vinaykumarii TaxID=407234 RepID=A0A1N7MAZ9_9RHOB|nr:DNA polymerase III subunit epsilon [Phaeovulum vinaykumarii]SIS83233.1 DNA polymerase-3 subunit epsilon [Phaeovulum vinaykumarii]SOC10348.1 DNA polymerase-3 subunit epsilon [Phaeovulum vinaykumarii]